MREYILKNGTDSLTLTSVMCLGYTPVLDEAGNDANKVMHFNRGANSRSYITSDPEEIRQIEKYLEEHQNSPFYDKDNTTGAKKLPPELA